MQDIDLGDRRGLIDLIYGPQKGAASDTPSVSTMTPFNENEKNEKKEKVKPKVVCTMCTAISLFLLVALCLILSAWASHYLTKEQMIRQMTLSHYMPQPRRNVSSLGAEEEIMYEEEEPAIGPTAAELALPKNIIPVWYNLTLKTYLPGYVSFPGAKNFTTEAHLMIKMKIVENTNTIVLNSREFVFPSEMTKISILSEERSNRVRREANSNETEFPEMAEEETSGESTNELIQKQKETGPEYYPSGISLTSLKYNATLQKLTLNLDKPLSAGQKVILKFPYGGKIDESLNGLYASTYKTKEGKKKTIAVTHLQPIHARKLLPCFDEPHLKAVFKISVIHPEGTRARGNAKELVENEKTEEAGWVQTTFEETAQTSTYLTALTVSDFEFKEALSKSGVRVRVWSRPEAVNSTEYALEQAVKTIDYLEGYYGTEMVYKKQDLFAIPDFEAGAMENPGLIMFRETSVLFDPMTNDVTDKIYVARKIAHELNHQWFGNLVTLSGWDSLWLNEAFARNQEYFSIENTLEGKVNTNQLELISSVEPALARDAQSSSHPLTVKIETANEAYEIFDMITYEKGASVVRMIKNVIGAESFQKGIQTYLGAFRNGNANYTQLWKSLSSAVPKKLKSWDGSSFDLASFANQWILQMGFPVLDVYRLDDRTVEITQRRFKIDNLTPEKAKYRNALYWYKWDVPLFFSINGQKQEMQWLHEAVRLPLNLSDSLLINEDSIGYYRVNYDENGWADIAKQLDEDHTKYSATARGRFISDAFALANSGQLPYETALNLTSYLVKETEFAPTKIAIDGLSAVYENLQDSDEGDRIKKIVQSKLADLYASIDISSLSTVDEAEALEVMRKKAIVEKFCQLSPKECKKTMMSLFEDTLAKCHAETYTSKCSAVPIPLRSAVYCNGVSKGDEETFETIFNYAKNEVAPNERKSLMKSLGCSRSPSTLKKILRDSLDKKVTIVSKQDLDIVIGSMNEQPVGKLVVSNWIIDNWKEINEKLSEDRDIIALLLKSGITVGNEREIKQLERFLSEHTSSAKGFGIFKQRLETARTKVNWLKKNKKQIRELFSKKNATEEL